MNNKSTLPIDIPISKRDIEYEKDENGYFYNKKNHLKSLDLHTYDSMEDTDMEENEHHTYNDETEQDEDQSSIRNRIVARSSMGTAFYLFSHQVGGHKPFLRSGPGEVCKPAAALELSFYRSLDTKFPQLKSFVPVFLGTIDVDLGQAIHYNNTNNFSFSEQSVPYGSSSTIDTLALEGIEELSIKSDTMNSLSTNQNYLSSSLPAQTSQIVSDITSDENTNEKQTAHSSLISSKPVNMRKKRRHPGYRRTSSGLQLPGGFSFSLWEKFTKNKAISSTKNISEYLVLGDLTQGYRRPCVLDIKMGTRQHGDDAPPAKVKSHSAKCEATTSLTEGLRLCGMQVYRSIDGQYLLRDKHWGRSLKPKDIEPALEMYLFNGNMIRLDVLHYLIERLNKLKEVIMITSGVRFWGASLLILYEGEQSNDVSNLISTFVSHSINTHNTTSINETTTIPTTSTNNNKSNIIFADIRLIDFAHCYQDSLLQTPDDGMLLGLTNLIGYFTNIYHRNPDKIISGCYLDVFPDE